MNKGEIYTAHNKQDHPHPIIFLEWIDRVTFKGCIISHEPGKGNIPMQQDHFFIDDENGGRYNIQFENSHLIPNETFRKMEFWVNCDKVEGQLTNLGINFIEPYTRGEAILCTVSIKKYRKG